MIICTLWDGEYHDFISGEERLSREVIKHRDNEIDSRFAALEKQIDLKNKATIEAV